MEESILESDNHQVNDESKTEEYIMKIIEKIRKDRNRAGYQNIQNFLYRRGIKLEMEKMKGVVNHLIERNDIIDKGKESFWIVGEASILESQDKTESEEELGISAIKEFFDDKFYSTLMNKIKIEVKVALNELTTSDDARIHKFIVKNQESNLNENEDLITILKKKFNLKI